MNQHVCSRYCQHFMIARPLPNTARGENDNGFWRRARCEEVDCPHYLLGWTTTLPVEDQKRCDYVRYESDRRFKEERVGGLVQFIFPPGQPCFRQPHWLPRDEEPLYVRQAPGTETRLQRRDQFTDDWNEMAHRVNTVRARG